MTQEADDFAEELDGAAAGLRLNRRWPRMIGAFALLLGLAVALAWFNRERIADNVIGGQLKDMGLPAKYRIVSVGAQRQVLSDLVIGDPAHPDLTIERAEVEIRPRFGWPVVGEVKLVRARLYGTYRQGKLSFGSLDKVLFDSGSKEPFRLPDMNLALEDGRARIDSDMGPLAVKLGGRGNLRSGFAGAVLAGLQGRAGDDLWPDHHGFGAAQVRRATAIGQARLCRVRRDPAASGDAIERHARRRFRGR
jgi:hypothetical protein